MIKIGISCATPRDGIVRDYCVSAEIRNCVEDGTPALIDMFKYCMANNIYAIVNFDLWTSTGHLKYNEWEWRVRIDGLVSELLKIEPTATKWRITIDNEPMKYMSKEDYGWLINIAYDQIRVKRGWNVKIGAGNEEFSLAAARGNMYEYILENCNFDYLDIHFQAAVINSVGRVDDNALNHWGNTAKQWALTYCKKLSCTEANWCNVSTSSGYTDLKKILGKAEEIGCEDFCIVFLDYRGSDYRWLCFNVNGNPISPYWTDMHAFIQSKKPIIIEDEDMKLDKLYMKGSKGIGVRFIQKVVNEQMHTNLLIDGCWGVLTEAGVKSFQKANGLLEDGKVGIETFPAMIEEYPNIWNQIGYAWAIGVR